MSHHAEGMVVRRAADRAWIHTADGVIECKMGRGLARVSGRLAVGDRVKIEIHSAHEARVTEVSPRKNYLPKPHLANLNQIIIVTAFKAPPMNLIFFDRMIVIGSALRLSLLLIFNKLDLAKEDERDISGQYKRLGYEVIVTSAKVGEGIHEFSQHLHGLLSVIVGVSGVGKTSLLRALDPNVRRPVGELSLGGGHGRHTTTRSEILFLRGKETMAVADTPGFDWLEFLPNSLQAIQNGFPEFVEHVRWCAFRDCAHLKETECAVRASAEAGTIWPSRYESYKKFAEELQTRPKAWERKRR